MATKILLKKSVTGGASPLTSDLDQGELAINLVDRKIYTKDSGNNIKEISGAYVDASAPSNPVEGDLWYDTANNLLKAHNGTGFVSAGYQNLSSLEDVTITSIASGEILKWDGSAFVNNTLAEAGIAEASHAHAATEITSGTLADARVAETNVTQHQAALSVTESQISDLQSYILDVTGDNLDALANVTVTSNSSGEILKWNGTAWVNNTLAEAGIAAGSHTHTASEITDFETAAEALFSAVDAGGDGSFSYANGVYTYTGPSAAEARAHFSAGTGVAISSGQVSIGQDVGTTDDVVFGKVTTNSMEHTGTITLNPNSGGAANEGVVVIAGDLTVNGTTTSVNSNEVNIGDSIILLNSDETGTPSQDGGIEIERGTSANVQFVWNESDTAWDLDNEELQNVTLDGGTY
jgi:hypothetical protein